MIGIESNNPKIPTIAPVHKIKNELGNIPILTQKNCKE